MQADIMTAACKASIPFLPELLMMDRKEETVMKTKLAIAIAALWMFSAPASADQCDTAKTQSEMSMCADLQYRKADAELNDAYRDLLAGYKKLDKDLASALTKSQRAWIAHRDADCVLESLASQGGSAQPMIFSMCLERITLERVKWLRGRLSCQEGDLSCVRVE
jgi:uncharacterized protein YecT (DUF1311 family)